MIKDVPKDHIMAEYASTWCCMRWEREQTLVELLDMLAHIGTVDGADWEEVDLPTLVDVVRHNKRLQNPPTKDMDFYWGWSLNQSGQKIRMDVFFTTEKQATYYAMAPTDDFPTEQDDAASILNAIRNRRNHGNAGGTTGNNGGGAGGSKMYNNPPPLADRSGSVPSCPPNSSNINPKAAKILQALRNKMEKAAGK